MPEGDEASYNRESVKKTLVTAVRLTAPSYLHVRKHTFRILTSPHYEGQNTYFDTGMCISPAVFVFDFALYVELKQTGRRVGGVWLEWITFVSPASLPPMYVSVLTRAEKQKHKETERKRKREVSQFNTCLSNQKSNTKGYLGRWIVNTVHSLWENTTTANIFKLISDLPSAKWLFGH